MAFTLTIAAMVIVLALCWRFLGAYMVAVYEGRAKWLKWLERPIYRVLRVDPEAEQTWPRYATSVIVFSGVALLLTYAIFRLQGHLPFNPSHFPGVRADTAWNTSVSFVTNTNWQSYSGEVTMSYLSQMGAVAVQNFLSAAVGMAVAVALIRGFARKGSKTIGNFWVDLVRGTVYVLLPIAFVAAIVFIGQGAVQTLGGAVHGAQRTRRFRPGPAARPDRLTGGDQATGHQRRRILQRQRRGTVRKPHRCHQHHVDPAHSLHPGRIDLHVREDGVQHSPGSGDPRGDGGVVRWLADHGHSCGAPRQPGDDRCRGERHQTSAIWRAKKSASECRTRRCTT